MQDVLILGAGAAGLFCAGIAGQRGLSVTVLEASNKPGKKVLMSGGGRCNFTNLGTTPAQFLSANPHFCKSALARYTPAQFVELVERHGIAYHEKELGQLFCDHSSKDILKLLLTECEYGGVTLHCDAPATAVDASDAGYTVTTPAGVFRGKKLVVATGGLSIPSLGGTDFGYRLARQTGHRVLATRAGLVPLTLSGQPQLDWCDLAGLALPVAASANDAQFAHQMLITHRGLSGPAMLQISNYWQPGQPLHLQLKADAYDWLLALKAARPQAELKTVLAEELNWPRRFAERFCEHYCPSRPLRQCDHPTLRSVAAALEHWPVTPNGTEGYRTAEVTLGGVDTTQVSSRSMESLLVPGLYFLGEVLDVTGWLGGYNFQWAWASAQACGQAL